MASILILGCGPHHQKQKGEILSDIRPFPNVDVVHDLNVFPWPWDFATMDRIIAIHVVEHLYCQLIPFMNQCWRILKPGGSVYIETPMAGVDVDLEWADPTHVRCYRPHSFYNYLTPEGIERFGYTDKAWAPAFCGARRQDPATLVIHAFPIKTK